MLESLGLDRIRCGGAACVIGAMATFQQVLDGPGMPALLRLEKVMVWGAGPQLKVIVPPPYDSTE